MTPTERAPEGAFTLGPLAERHIDRLLALEQRCFSVPWSREAFLSDLRNPHAFYVVCECGDVVAGFIAMLCIDDTCDVLNVAVDPAYRRRHLATAMLREAMRQARTLGAQRLLLEVREHNAPAIAFYEREGFRPFGRRSRYYTQPDEDAILMAWEPEG